MAADPKYSALSSPFRSIGAFTEVEQEALLREESEVLDGTTFKILGKAPYRRGTQILRAGELTLIAGRTTPVQSSNQSEAFSCFFAMPLMGGFISRDGALCDEVGPGDLYLNQHYYATSTMGYLSALFVALNPQRLDRTIRSISPAHGLAALGPSTVLRAGGSLLWRWIAYIDQLHSESATIPGVVGVDEQFYRLLAMALLESCGGTPPASQPSSHWNSRLDELVDSIRADPNRAYTLTELEQRSHYSARQLQNLFQAKFHCTPMQFVRRQRLAAAMELLQTAGPDATVISISRACGYRSASHFAADFQRQFGHQPSAVLHAARQRQ